MHKPFDDIRYLPDATSNVNYFFFVAYVKCRLYEINKKTKEHGMWTESDPKNVPRPNRSDVGPERSRISTWTLLTLENMHTLYAK